MRRPASPSGARACGPRTWLGRGPRGCAPRSGRARPRRAGARLSVDPAEGRGHQRSPTATNHQHKAIAPQSAGGGADGRTARPVPRSSVADAPSPPRECQVRPSPPQQQRLLDGRLRPEVRLLGHALLARLPGLDPRQAQPVVVQPLLETHRQLPPAAPLQLMRRRRQVVVMKAPPGAGA